MRDHRFLENVMRKKCLSLSLCVGAYASTIHTYVYHTRTRSYVFILICVYRDTAIINSFGQSTGHASTVLI